MTRFVVNREVKFLKVNHCNVEGPLLLSDAFEPRGDSRPYSAGTRLSNDDMKGGATHGTLLVEGGAETHPNAELRIL